MVGLILPVNSATGVSGFVEKNSRGAAWAALVPKIRHKPAITGKISFENFIVLVPFIESVFKMRWIEKLLTEALLLTASLSGDDAAILGYAALLERRVPIRVSAIRLPTHRRIIELGSGTTASDAAPPPEVKRASNG